MGPNPRALRRKTREGVAHARVRRDYSKATWSDVINRWSKTWKPHTGKTYTYALRNFARFLGRNPFDIPGLAREFFRHGIAGAHEMAEDFKDDLIEKGRAPSTVALNVSALRALVKAAHKLMPEQITWELQIDTPSVETMKDTRGPSPEAVRQILRTAEQRGRKWIDRRNIAILHILATMGLRPEELSGLDLEHVDWKEGRLWILGKARNNREPVTMPEPTQYKLGQWTKVRGTAPGPLFFGRGSRVRLGAKGTWRLVRAAAIKALGEAQGSKVYPRAFRHSAITMALDLSNGDVRMAQKFSRHKDLSVLMVYDDNRRDEGGRAARLIANHLGGNHDGNGNEEEEPEQRPAEG